MDGYSYNNQNRVTSTSMGEPLLHMSVFVLNVGVCFRFIWHVGLWYICVFAMGWLLRDNASVHLMRLYAFWRIIENTPGGCINKNEHVHMNLDEYIWQIIRKYDPSCRFLFFSPQMESAVTLFHFCLFRIKPLPAEAGSLLEGTGHSVKVSWGN